MKLLLLAACTLVSPAISFAAPLEDSLLIKDHRFTPVEIRVPAGQKIRLTIDNQDASDEEFDSHDLNREKVIPGKTKGVVFIGPLSPGKYEFIGEFHDSTARGAVIAE